MKRPELCAWHSVTRQPVRLRWNRRRIIAVEPLGEPPSRPLWVAPPLLDLQINGFAGVDFQQDGLSRAKLLHATRRLAAAGCPHFLLTLMTDHWPRMLARLAHLRGLRAQSSELRAAIAGWHLEGPFLLPEPGFCGAHNPRVMEPATPKHIRQVRRFTGDDPVLLTISPGNAEALAAITLARQLGMKVSLGHTNASSTWLRQAVQAGATGFTHLGNGCPTTLDRSDNILWRALDTPGLTISLIPDRAHVSPALFRLIHRVLPASSIYYISDAMAAAGLPPGRFTLGPLVLEVGRDKVVRLPGSRNLAGSAVSPLDAVLRAAEMLRCDWQEAWRHFTEVPAQFMGWTHDLVPGAPANFCLVETGKRNRPKSIQVFVRGKRISSTNCL